MDSYEIFLPLSGWGVWDRAWLRARPSPCCPEETAARRSSAPPCWSRPARGFSVSVFCPSLCACLRCPTPWTSPCRWCIQARPCSEWGRRAGARPRTPSGLASRTAPCSLSCKTREPWDEVRWISNFLYSLKYNWAASVVAFFISLFFLFSFALKLRG